MMTEAEGRLFEALLREWPASFERGRSDCCALVARWAEVLTGRMPGEDLFLDGPYTVKEAILILKRWGGLSGMINKVFTDAGWKKAEGPAQDGDVAIVDCETALGGETVGVWRDGWCVTIDELGGVRPVKGEPKGIWRWE